MIMRSVRGPLGILTIWLLASEAGAFAQCKSGTQNPTEDIVKVLREKAEAGDAAAQFRLGVMYANGKGVPKDAAEAVKWFSKAAEQGYADAQFNLGVMCANGEGVMESPSAAADWYYKAGLTYLANDNREKALTCYDAINRVSPGNPLAKIMGANLRAHHSTR
jgi:hypothetical protein